MPGICTIIDLREPAGVPDRLGDMIASLVHHNWYLQDRHADPATGVGLGRVSLGVVNAASQPVRNREGTCWAVMDGELYEADSIRRELTVADCSFASDSHAEILLHGWKQHGPAFLRHVNGSFVLAIWDAGERRLLLANDRFGMRPLYVAKTPGKLLAASTIRALMTDSDVSRTPNLCGLAQFFTFGQYFGNDTSLAGVEVLPAASVLTYDLDDDRVSIDPYWHLEDDASLADGGLLESIDAAFKAAVDRQTLDTPNLGLALSGGLDARTILGAVDRDAVELKTVCLGIEGSLDHRSATEMARLAGCSHHNHVLDTHFLADFRRHLDGMVNLTDGQYLSQCIIMPTLPVYRELGIEVLLRGHAGELMHMHKAYAFSLDDEAMQIKDEAGLARWLSAHLQAYMLDGVDGPLFAPPHQDDLQPLARQSLNNALAQASGVESPLQRIWQLFITQRLRRETALSLVKFGSVVETRLPYLDSDLIRLLMAAPPELKLDETIQTHILRRHMPELCDVVNVNTGTRLGASTTTKKFMSLRNRVFAKLGVKGYQPYERLGLWLRRELAPMVQEILLADACLDRGIFHPDTTRTVVDNHLAGRRNHTFLLMALMICELGQQRLATPAVEQVQR